ncbi:MAG: phosphoribosyltransferase [Halobacteriota archaeon]|nr:phosphoribosyltransferase [Halobacteriota archaeon]
MSEEPKYEMRSWDDVYEDSKELSEKIKDDGYNPDLIVGLARGGWVPARNLCDFLGVRDLISLKLEHWGITASPDGEAKIKYPIDVDLTGKDILVVDDCSDTGESIKTAKRFLDGLNPQTVKTATMHVFETTPDDGIPDFWAEKIPWVWVIYPWNLTEDLINLTKKLIEIGEKMDAKNIQEGFKREFYLSIHRETIESTLRELKRRDGV